MSSNPTGTVGIPPERGAVEVGGREVALALQRSQVGDTFPITGTTIVAATHDFDVACRVDHCVLLSGGRVVSSGVPADVLTEANVASAVIPTLGR